MFDANNFLATAEQCTGCGACASVCAAGAIEIKATSHGFDTAHIDASKCVQCGRCADICPIVFPPTENSLSPGVYAFRAEENIRSMSSSGGAFSALAIPILARGGYVAGAAFDENGKVKHILAANEQELSLLRGSKYVQSEMGVIYEQILDKIPDGKPILFSGTPCQVAAMRKCIPSACSNIYYVDILCHGVSSQAAFSKYLAEIARGRAIRHVSFRDKRYGWNGFILRIEFANGEVYEGKPASDPYLRAYASNLFLRQSCLNCKFCDFPRQGDISIGDFWGFDKVSGGDGDNGGTSIVFLNNERAKGLAISLLNAPMFMPVNVDVTTLPNRMSGGSGQHAARERYLDLLKERTFASSVDASLKGAYDVGIVGTYRNHNFGGYLTYYALYNVVKEMGYTPLMISQPKSAAWGYWPLEDIVESETYPAYARAPEYANRQEMTALNEKCGQFIVGSDQQYNPEFYKSWGEFTKLDWVHDYKKKLAYASSFGGDGYFRGDEKIRADMAYFLRKFDAFSVREYPDVKLCADELGVSAQRVLDPVFLCDSRYYLQFANQAPAEIKTHEVFLNSYMLLPIADKEKILEDVQKELNIPLRLWSDMRTPYKYGYPIIESKLNTKLWNLIHGNFTVTDSFHGTCMAIIFRKNFISFGHPQWTEWRMKCILDDCGLGDRLIASCSWAEYMEKKELLLAPIDFDAVYERLNPKIEESREWLLRNLNSVVKKPLSDRDYLVQQLGHI